ncbi:MAG: HIT domain-containing protein [Nanoarchaeota archaeon]
MSLTQEQVKELKAQLSEQIQHLQEPQKSQAQKQIDDLSAEALEDLVRQQQERSSGTEKTIYRMIVDGEVAAVKAGENSSALAVLEINPISKGHMLIIPKEIVQDKEIPKEAQELAESLSKKIVRELGAKKVEIISETKFGEKIINLIPIYDAPLTLKSPRKKASKEELEKIIIELNPVRKPEPIIMKEKPAQLESLKQKRKVP